MPATIESTAGAIAEYFGTDPRLESIYIRIDQAYFTGRGWTSQRDANVPATITALRNLSRRGATAVAVRYGDRIADFQIDQVIAYARRPLLGGRLI